MDIINYTGNLNPSFKKISRKSTRFIIIHTSEAGLSSTLRTVSKGKRVRSYRTRGGHCHYVIARNGRIYQILSTRYRADHTGLSMWNGISDLSSHSLGIELVGYHYGKITSQQYRSLAPLLDTLQSSYGIEDRNVLTHSQISYGTPNRWFKRNHRGRKRCALNFKRQEAGLSGGWTTDPDVNAGRLMADPMVTSMFYGPAASKGGSSLSKGRLNQDQPQPAPDRGISNLISKWNTAWNIAGEDYDSQETVYVFPNLRQISGDRIEAEIGWDQLPRGTRVILNQPRNGESRQGPIYTINGDFTAWSFAGKDYSKTTTKYFFPDGKILPGDRVSDWDDLPDNTRLIIGYSGPYTIFPVPGQTAWGRAGKRYNHAETVYWIPGRGVLSGDKIKDFNDLPRGSQIFIKKR